MSSSMTIDLADVSGGRSVRNLSGKERGVAARLRLGLDDMDRSAGTVRVVIPPSIDTISPSFFQGLFSQSLRELKGKGPFLEKYRFVASDDVMRWIDVGIRNATASREPLI